MVVIVIGIEPSLGRCASGSGSAMADGSHVALSVVCRVAVCSGCSGVERVGGGRSPLGVEVEKAEKSTVL